MELPVTTVVCALSGVLWRDQPLREQVLQELLLRENIAPRKRHPWYRGGTDREFLAWIWQSYRRSLSEDYLTQLVRTYRTHYQQAVMAIPDPPWYDHAQTFVQQVREHGYPLGLYTEPRGQAWWQWLSAHLPQSFAVTDYCDVTCPQTTLVFESTMLGIQRAKAAGCWVVGVAQQIPYHWIHRHAHWAIDSLAEWDWHALKPEIAPTPA
jgi:hypothetical protein